MALEITDANFEEVVLKSDKPVLVDFWAAGVDLVEWWVLLLMKFTESMTEKLL